LIVEDSPDLQLLLAQLLSGEGYRVSRAFNGQQALEFLQTTQDLPTLILLDIMMPVMDGFEFREAQRLDPRIAAIPFVVMTADYNAKVRAKTMGAVDVIQKPILDIDNLIETADRFSRG
jgi:CheY-like chemotaxis protein